VPGTIIIGASIQLRNIGTIKKRPQRWGLKVSDTFAEGNLGCRRIGQRIFLLCRGVSDAIT
jgi:hypothetical protein